MCDCIKGSHLTRLYFLENFSPRRCLGWELESKGEKSGRERRKSIQAVETACKERPDFFGELSVIRYGWRATWTSKARVMSKSETKKVFVNHMRSLNFAM